MRLAPASHDQLERFFRQYFDDETLTLPRVKIHAGLFAARLTKTFKISAITFGSRVLIAPGLFSLDDDEILRVSGRLFAHEVTHVLQYKRVGHVRFLSRYLREYAAAWMKLGGRGAGRHWAAYRAINFEKQARDAEDAYVSWMRAGATRSAPV
ncbi:MAG: hypothetical protein QOE33_2530 [Acidobacteriota bacterium]|nr:hypothetical protein [Acidobacteriota bacterium]